MPRKAKGVENEIETNQNLGTNTTRSKSKTKSNSNAKKASTSKKKNTSVSPLTGISTKSTSTKKSATSKKSSLDKNTKTVTNKKTTAKKKKGTVVSTLTGIPANDSPTKEILEYYDLPYRYNETIVKVLAQTPKKLFIYWDISDDDRKKYIDKFGADFFNNTVPVLIIHNDSMNYTFEIEINDFANCWYLDINDAKTKYTIELGRRSKKENYTIPNNYIYITSSNEIESPNDHILFENQSNTVYFRNVKNNTTYTKNIATLSFIRNMGKIYNIYEVYKKLYNDENIIDINNPSSSNPTSTFK